MHATLPLLESSDFPSINRGELTTLQVNLGYICNQQCLHCHVNAGPRRKEIMSTGTIASIKNFLRDSTVKVLDLTGGAPEMNPGFRELVRFAREHAIHVMDRCNLTILSEPGQEALAQFLADHKVELIASLPCYSQENVDQQRGKGVFAASIVGLQMLNKLGYGKQGSGLLLNLVYNPLGPNLPPPQLALESDYKARLLEDFGIEFNSLFTITNMPIKRFGSTLVSKGQFQDYMQLLKDNYAAPTLSSVMCRSLISVDWQGYLYDCDFNQMLDLPLRWDQRTRVHIDELSAAQVAGKPIQVADHCYACTAGQGSSCGGALAG